MGGGLGCTFESRHSTEAPFFSELCGRIVVLQTCAMLVLARRSHARAWLPLRRHSTTAVADTEPLTMRLPTVCVWGANTGVGKTLFSAGLAAACERAKVSTRSWFDSLATATGAVPCPCPAFLLLHRWDIGRAEKLCPRLPHSVYCLVTPSPACKGHRARCPPSKSYN